MNLTSPSKKWSSAFVAAMLSIGILQAQENAKSSSPAAGHSDALVVRCEGDYAGHLQGVAVDEDCNIYWSWTRSIVKTDGSGKKRIEVEAPNHQGDLCYVDGYVYVAVNLGKFNQPAGTADSWVYKFDAKTLKLVEKYEIQEAVHGAGGIEHLDGKFYVVGGLPENVDRNFVFEYDANFKLVKKHEILSGWTKLGIQTAFFKDNQWWFGCYGKPQVTIRTDKDFSNPRVYEWGTSYGLASGGEGFGRFLVADSKRDAQGKHLSALHTVKLTEEALLKLKVR